MEGQVQKLDEVQPNVLKPNSPAKSPDIEEGEHSIEPTVQELEDEIQSMLPIYWVGVDIRQRNFEQSLWTFRDVRRNHEIIQDSNMTAHCGRVLADAILCSVSCSERRQHTDDFEDLYNNVPAAIVLDHRDFTRFHNILGWHHDIKSYTAKYGVWSGVFDDRFEYLFNRIYPHFRVSSNEEIDRDAKLKAAYCCLKDEHAWAAHRIRDIRGGTNRRMQ